MNNRPRISLDGTWQFWTDPGASRSPDSLPLDGAFQIQVPAPWQSQAPELRMYTGTGWYRRTFHIDDGWLDDRVVLGFGAVDYCAEIWLNGARIGENEGGYLPFECDITAAARLGENTLIVRVSDDLELFPEIPHGKQSWYGPLSGLWQSVWVERRPEIHIRSLRATPTSHSVEVDIELNRPLSGGENLLVEIQDPDGQVVTRQETSHTRLSLPVPNPQLWDLDTPRLYTLSAALQAPGSDKQSVTYGFRTVEARDAKLFLNGRPLYLRGALDQDYYPELISTPPSYDYIEAQFRQAKAMGLNCLRVHIKIADPRYYEAADRVGLLIWTELPNWQSLTPAAARRARDTLFGMLRRDWNHPSIIIWTIINESWGIDLTDPSQRRWLAEMYDVLKQVDPTRLIVGNSACEGNHQVVTDVADFHNYYHIPDHYRKWRRWVRDLASRPCWTFARPYENFRTWKKFLNNPWDRAPYIHPEEVRRTETEPLFVSEFGNWGLPDVQKLYECYGGEPWWFETGFEWSDGEVYPHGIEHRFRNYHLERVFPSLSALAYESQRLQFEAMKYEIEQIRLQPNLSGYIITEFTDVHWECNGLLDMCRNPKMYFDRMGGINADDLLIPEWRRLAYWAGERATLRLALSHFSPADLQGSRLEWELDGEVRGSIPVLNPHPYTVTHLGTIAFTVPQVDQGTRAHLRFRLFSATGEMIAENEQQLFFFPRLAARPIPARLYAPDLAPALRSLGYEVVNDLQEADIALVNVLDDGIREYLLSGGRVLWLAETDKALQTHLKNFRVRKRRKYVWQGDWASSLSYIRQDRLFQDIPCSGLVDFAFADLTPEHVILRLQQNEYAHHVFAGLSVGWLHRMAALIVERRVGLGYLLTSTFRLSRRLETHPVAAIMLQNMLRHLAQKPHEGALERLE